MLLLTFLISQFLCIRPCGLYFSLLFSPFYASPIWFPITRDKFPPRLSHGQIWSSLPVALIIMSQLLKPFSASNTLLFCLFPRSLVLSLSHLCLTSPFIAQSRSKLGSPFYCFIGIGLTAHYLQTIFWVSFSGSVSTSLRPFSFFPAQVLKGWGYFCLWLSYSLRNYQTAGRLAKRCLSCLFRTVWAAETAWLSHYGIQVTVYVSSVTLRML